MNSDYNNFVARVALEVVDSAWWKQQLRVKSAGIGTTALRSLQHERSKQNETTVLHFDGLTPTGELHKVIEKTSKQGCWVGP